MRSIARRISRSRSRSSLKAERLLRAPGGALPGEAFVRWRRPTRTPILACKSLRRPPRSIRLRSGRSSTSKSMSLHSVASPRAIDPKTRTFCAPWRAAKARIVSRLDLRSSSSVMFRRFSPPTQAPAPTSASRACTCTPDLGIARPDPLSTTSPQGMDCRIAGTARAEACPTW